MLTDIPDGSACFIDANIFYYHFVEVSPVSEQCTAFLERVGDGRITGHTSTHQLAEAIHKVMLAEAAAHFTLNRAGLTNWLQNHQPRIIELSEFRQAAKEFTSMGIKIVPANGDTLRNAASLANQFGLLTNDSILLALMRTTGLVNLATNDNDFDRVPDLALWKPR